MEQGTQSRIPAPCFLSTLHIYLTGLRIASHQSERILNDLTGCVLPSEMLLVHGRPDSGCSTLLKILANQGFGYKSIKRGITRGETEAKSSPIPRMIYATLSVKNALGFALKTRVAGKLSRNGGESRADYVDK